MRQSVRLFHATFGYSSKSYPHLMPLVSLYHGQNCPVAQDLQYDYPLSLRRINLSSLGSMGKRNAASRPAGCNPLAKGEAIRNSTTRPAILAKISLD